MLFPPLVFDVILPHKIKIASEQILAKITQLSKHFLIAFTDASLSSLQLDTSLAITSARAAAVGGGWVTIKNCTWKMRGGVGS